MLVQPVRPLPNSTYMDVEGVVHLRGRADRKGMPLEAGDLWDFDEHPIPRAEVEAGGSLDDEVRHPGGQDHTRAHHGLAPPHQAVQDPVGELDGEHDQEEGADLVEVGGVEDEEAPVDPVEEMGAVEDLEVATASNPLEGANHHDGEDADEGDPCDICTAMGHAQDARAGGKDPLGIRPASAHPW